MRKNIVLCSFDQKSANFSFDFDEQYDPQAHPGDTTLGFRQVFWRCFSAVRSSTVTGETISWLGKQFSLTRLFLFESENTTLSETENNNYIVAFILESENDDEKSINELRYDTGQNEQEAIFSLFSALPDTIQNTFTKHLSHSLNYPGLSSLEINNDTPADETTCALLFSFFYWGKLILWRIRRDQADINISVLQENFENAIFMTAIQRSRIINVKRFQMTSNITNNQQIRKTANTIKKRLNLQNEYENNENLNTLFEEHLASLEKLFLEESRRKIERAVLVFSFVAVPFTILAALLSLKTDAQMVRSTLYLFGNLNVWILLAVCAVIPFLPYAATSLVSRRPNIATRLARYREKRGASKTQES